MAHLRRTGSERTMTGSALSLAPDLSPSQAQEIEFVVGPGLERYGYL